MNKRYRLGEIEEAVAEMEELIDIEDDIAEIDNDFQIVVSCWSVYVESTNVILPILPQYIIIMIIMRPTVFKSLVMPVVMPTVLIAEYTSNSTSSISILDVASIAITAVSPSTRLMISTIPAFLITSLLIFLPNTLQPLHPLRYETI